MNFQTTLGIALSVLFALAITKIVLTTPSKFQRYYIFGLTASLLAMCIFLVRPEFVQTQGFASVFFTESEIQNKLNADHVTEDMTGIVERAIAFKSTRMPGEE